MDQVLWQQFFSDEGKTRAKPLGADQRLLIIQKLQGKLDLGLLFEIFTREVEKQIDINRLVWEIDDTCSIIRRGKASEFQHTFALRFGDEGLGLLKYSTPYQLDKDEINLLHTYHRLFTGPLCNAVNYQRVKNMALRDYLSGLGNRTSFEQDIHHALAISERENVGLVLLMFDLDNFKQVNDTYGHLDGDKVIQRFSHVLKDAVRASDRCYRLGGDEFAAILQPATNESALKVAQRVKVLVARDPLLNNLNIGTSIGFSIYNKGDNLTSLYERADRLLYQQKKNKKSNK